MLNSLQILVRVLARSRTIWIVLSIYIFFGLMFTTPSLVSELIGRERFDLFDIEFISRMSYFEFSLIVISALFSFIVSIYIYSVGKRFGPMFLSILTGVGQDDNFKHPNDYLSSSNEFAVYEFSKRVDYLEKRLAELEAQQRTGLTEEDRSTLSETVVDELRAGISGDVLAKIKKEYGKSFLEQKRLEEVDEKIESIVRRLSRERQTITLWTFLNLAAGGIAAAYGAYLFYQMIGNMRLPTTEDGIFYYTAFGFLARLSLIIIIEVFAYFFLNLYRTGLQEIKFYQNEITNALNRQAGIRAALLGSDKAVISNAIKQLVETERNFILKKGESTVGLEQNRIDRDADNQIVDAIASAYAAGIKKARGAAAKAAKK